MSAFSEVKIAPAIEVFALVAAYNNDAHPNKVNLSVGGMYQFNIVLCCIIYRRIIIIIEGNI